MVAIALSGVLAVAVMRLLTNQAQMMRVLELREQRMQLLRHYRDAVSAGLLSTITRRCGGGNVCSADGRVLIPRAGLYLGDNLYEYGNSSADGRWWRVSAAHAPPGRYAGLGAVVLTVEFRHKHHPVVKTQLKPVTEVILLPLNP